MQRLEFIDFMKFFGGFKHYKDIADKEEMSKVNLEETQHYYSLYKENNLFAEVVKLTLQIEWGEGATIDLETGVCTSPNSFEKILK